MPDTSTHNASVPNASLHTHKPFVIEIRQDRPKSGGAFIPAASLKLNEEFRTSGLLQALSPEDLKNLLFLLTFITPEGHCTVSLPILTSAMKVPSVKVKTRMHRLAGTKWQGEPLIIEVPHESGLFTYSLHPHMVAYEHLTVSEPHPSPPMNAWTNPTAARNQIVSYSRDHYARPRQEVERIVAAQLGHDRDETDEQRTLRYRLENVGLTGEQAREVISMHDADVIAQQLDWLPFRHAKNPAGYLMAAIEGGYSEPRGVREERLLREMHYAADPYIEEEVSPEERQASGESNLIPEPLDPTSAPPAEIIPSTGVVTDLAADVGAVSSVEDVADLEPDGEAIILTPEP